MTKPVKKLPLRKCVGCQEMKNKKELIRILRTETGEVLLDTTGKKNGRGAYLCHSADCLAKAIRSKALERSLKTTISEETYAELKKEMGVIEES